MKKFLLSLIPDIILDLFSLIHKVFVALGLADKPKDLKAIAQRFKEERVGEEVDSLFNLGEGGDDPNRLEGWHYNGALYYWDDLPDWDDHIGLTCYMDSVEEQLEAWQVKNVAQHIRNDDMVLAIKAVRDATGISLKDAKRIVDWYSPQYEEGSTDTEDEAEPDLESDLDSDVA